MNNLGKAFSFPFKDPEWVSKFVLAALFMILSLFVVGIFIVSGYLVQVTQRVMRNEENPMPAWDDIGVKLVVGFKYFVVHLVYALPIFIIFGIFFIVAIVSGFSAARHEGAFIGMFFVGYMFTIFFTVLYSFVLAALTPVIAVKFAERENIGDALDIAEVWKFFRRNWQMVAIVALIAVGLQSFSGIGLILFLIGVLFTMFYAYLVSAYMYGIVYREQVQEGGV
jgi:hypothetical protein